MIELVEEILSAYRPKTLVPVEGESLSAVLVPLFESGGELGVVFIRRSDSVRLHRGQMGFPGGMAEERDGGDLVRTALRETQEELGVASQDVRAIGRLSDVRASSSGILVAPFAGSIPFPCLFSPDPVEVRGVHTVLLKDLARSVHPGKNPFSLPPPVYPVDGQPVWGLSARILEELLTVLSGLIT